MILLTTLTLGGAGAQAVCVAEEFKNRGWEVCIACFGEPLAFVNRLRRRQIELHSLEIGGGIPTPAAIFRLRKLIRAFRPNVVHTHTFGANLLGRITRPFCNIPKLVCTIHGRQETLESGSPSRHKDFLYWLTDTLADRTTVTSHGCFERYRKIGAVSEQKLEMVPNGVDTLIFSNSEACKKAARHQLGLGDEFVWLAPTQLVNEKYYDDLFDALEQIGKCELAVLLLGYGRPDSKLRGHCDQRCFKNKLRFYSACENSLPFYQAADALVMPSKCEGVPMALLEAAAVGVPVIVADNVIDGDTVMDGETGFLVPPEHPARLAAAMRTLMEAPANVRRLLGDTARRYAIERFGLPIIVDAWERIYVDGGPLSAAQSQRSARMPK